MRDYKIVETGKEYVGSMYKSMYSFFVKEWNLEISFGHRTLYMTDLTNAFLKGKESKIIEIWLTNSNDDYCVILNYIMKNFNEDYRKFFDSVSETHKEYEQFNVSLGILKSNKVFSPFHPERVKPLKETPKKWTRPLAIRALFNNQVKNVKMDYYCSDDSRYDQTDKTINNIQSLAIDFFRTSFASVGAYKEKVCLRYHSNLSYSFTFDIQK